MKACGWCGEENEACKCAWTCADCGCGLTNQEYENNNDKYRPENKQPNCDRCVWALKN